LPADLLEDLRVQLFFSVLNLIAAIIWLYQAIMLAFGFREPDFMQIGVAVFLTAADVFAKNAKF